MSLMRTFTTKVFEEPMLIWNDSIRVNSFKTDLFLPDYFLGVRTLLTVVTQHL